MGDKGDMMKQSSSFKEPQPQEELHHQYQLQRHQKQQHREFCVPVPPASANIPSPYTPKTLAHREEAERCEPSPKRPRYPVHQWKLIPATMAAPASTQQQVVGYSTSGSSPQAHVSAVAGSSSPAPSSPSSSPRPSFSAGSGQDQAKPTQFLQIRKGKFVSPVWKPNEMLWLARAWRQQYCGGDTSEVSGSSARAKTRAEKDKQVAEFLSRHGVNRDAKTSGTKWDNMLGEFRKVYEWEKGGENEKVGKSYFRLSPYERKMHRLPASFDEDVFEEMAQFMAARGRGLPACKASTGEGGGARDQQLLRPTEMVRNSDEGESPVSKQRAILARNQTGLIAGTTQSSAMEEAGCREMRRVGKMRMLWEESVTLWAEEGEQEGRGRIKMDNLGFLNVNQLTFFDDTMAANSMEGLDDGPLSGFSADTFACDQQLRVFGRRNSSAGDAKVEAPDRSEYFVGRLRVPPQSLPTLLELPWHLQEPPPHHSRIPLARDVFADLPSPSRHFFFAPSSDCNCRSFTYEVLGPLVRPHIDPLTRDSFIPIWDDCINRPISKLCPFPITIVRKPVSESSSCTDSWPNLTAFVKNLCLWRGEETDCLREGTADPSSSIVDKSSWTFGDLPYILGYHAVGYTVTFCAFSRVQDRIARTDLVSIDLSNPAERLRALVACWRVAGILALLADACGTSSSTSVYSDFERVDRGNGKVVELTPNRVKKYFTSRRWWASVREVYNLLDRQLPHAEYMVDSSERELAVIFEPRGHSVRPSNGKQLMEALACVAKALVALHDLSFMHRSLGWESVVKRADGDEWFVVYLDEAAAAPQMYRHGEVGSTGRAPEMGCGAHGVKVDIWGFGNLLRTCGFAVSHVLKELETRCLDRNPEQRPTAADCYHQLLQIQSSLSTY
ncbi:uncharacterized protein LOC18424474 [Amborella trichopoda]|uniref:uncharacterized protein LOC18424474 n=1 Tax=Amborella trichopoda TaxID=13333 RepID=UPI0005D44BA4|nr:uncharacterized protein LOC18424474 [Amborella trichopoda]|eukprot:XP_011629107.1 uncharacterized protein LOC18424474 [Amborella trichopoda]